MANREEGEEGEKGGKEREEIEEKGGNGVKGDYPTAYREFVERIKENQGKQVEAISPLVVEALGMIRQRFVKAVAKDEADTEADADKQHSVEPEVHSSSPSDGFQ
ncbi:uncharacterized protein MONOS_17397 [Monocercomonoides exilis]|uniref:uncharacterized protein n=1 Tax=Monocercomonoides exilis TaxID=2049356 RepID=UPI00355A9029|nr:hypothetical protein MONOS_17397 [Monocercomonoides exilis]